MMHAMYRLACKTSSAGLGGLIHCSAAGQDTAQAESLPEPLIRTWMQILNKTPAICLL